MDAGAASVGAASLELGPRATRAAVALVAQEIHVFAGTLADEHAGGAYAALWESWRGAR